MARYNYNVPAPRDRRTNHYFIIYTLNSTKLATNLLEYFCGAWNKNIYLYNIYIIAKYVNIIT